MTKGIQSIQELMQAEPEKKLLKDTEHVFLPAQESIEPEVLMLQALLEDPLVEEVTSRSSSASRWLWWLGPVLAGACGVLMLVVWQSREHTNPSTQRSGWSRSKCEGVKGPGHPCGWASIKKISLQVGRVGPGNSNPQQLKGGQICHTNQSLVFGFFVASPGGYVYLFQVGSGKQPKLLYPLDPKQPPVYRHDTSLVHTLTWQGRAMGLPLHNLHGRVTFVAIQSSRVLTNGELKAILDTRNGLGPAMKALQAIKHRRGVSFDRFLSL